MIADLWWRLVRFGFRLLYYEMAFTYDLVSWVVSLGQWRCWQRSVFGFLPDWRLGPILELAHGTGNLQIDLQSAGYKTIAFDLSPYMGKIAKRKVERHGLEDDFVRGSAFQLPFAENTFSAIVCTFPTDFIIQASTLSEINRILVSGGNAVIVLNGMLTGGGIVKAFLEWLYRITGQRDEGRERQIEQYFDGYGMQVDTAEISCRGSVAQLVILTKS